MPVYFLWGDEDYLIEQKALKIKKEVLKNEINGLNYKTVDNPGFSLFSELLRTNPMIFGDIVIQIKCAKYFLESKNKEKLDEAQTKELIDAINNISDRVHIILICETPRGEKKKPDSRKKLYKELIKITKPEEFQSYKTYEEYKLIPVVKKMANELEMKINQPECSLIIQTIGSSLRDIANQLEKLKLYAYPENIVTKEMIEKIISAKTDIFNITDLILKKEYNNAIYNISNLLQKEHYLPMLAFIQTTFTNLVKLKLYSNTLSSYELAMKLNQNEYVIKKNLEKIKNTNLEELIRLKINLTEAEYKLKTGAIKDPICALELAFLKNGEN